MAATPTPFSLGPGTSTCSPPLQPTSPPFVNSSSTSSRRPNYASCTTPPGASSADSIRQPATTRPGEAPTSERQAAMVQSVAPTCDQAHGVLLAEVLATASTLP